MRNGIALSAISIGLLVACGPHDIDLGGGSGGQGTGGDGISTGGVGGSSTGVGGSGAIGGSSATGGTGGDEGANCGDGVVQFPETCDDAGEPGGCPNSCGLVGDTGGRGGVGGSDDSGGTGGSPEQYCGDGVVQYPETCDDPGSETCPVDCGLVGGAGGTGAVGGSDGSGGYGGVGGSGVGGGPAGEFCGDLLVGAGETCDDGNTVGGDGCSADCQWENGGVGGGGGVGGSFSTGGGPASGGTGQAGMPGNSQCSTEIVEEAEECADNDVMLGRAYERCMALGRALAAVRFTDPCSDTSSHLIEIDCCVRAGSGAGGSTGSAGQSSTGGVGGSG